MYSIENARTGGAIEFNTIPEIECFVAGAVYGVLLQYETEHEGYTLSVGDVASIIVNNLSVPGVEIDIQYITDRVSALK